ncbi:MAG: hypothetical protein ACQRW7_11995 [Caulobacterales bacterium]|uniref:hypothetical protein n=1 Tax=Glycocaulis sp. TaxID=1969725 RepID=UPI003F9F0E70
MTDAKPTRKKARSTTPRKAASAKAKTAAPKKASVSKPPARIEAPKPAPAIIDRHELAAYHDTQQARIKALTHQLAEARAHGEALQELAALQARALDDIEAKRLASEAGRTAMHRTLRQIETSLVWRYARIVRAAGRRLGPLARLSGLVFGGFLELVSGRIFSRTERKSRRKALMYEDRAVILTSDLFDAQWYAACYPDTIDHDGDALDHYIRLGAQEGRNPNPAFDTAWYLASYPEVAASGRNPLAYYALFGIAQKHAASPRFDTHWYKMHNASHLTSGMTPLQHYIHAGQWMGLSTQASDAARAHAVPSPGNAARIAPEPALPALKPVSPAEH